MVVVGCQSKKDSGQRLWTGISMQGVVMCEHRGDTRLVTRRHPWHQTAKISFNRRRFSIQPKTQAGPVKVAKLNYCTDSYKK